MGRDRQRHWGREIETEKRKWLLKNGKEKQRQRREREIQMQKRKRNRGSEKERIMGRDRQSQQGRESWKLIQKRASYE